MAGAYPDQPSYRMAWHLDGTQVITLSTGVNLSQGNLNTLNSESGNVVVTSDAVCVIFPEPRDLDALWLNGTSSSVSTEVSTDTTNGVDGSWVAGPAVTVVSDNSNPLGPGWRNSITSSTFLGVKGLRFTLANMRNLHLYGEITDPQGKRLELWHPTLDQKISVNALDWGFCPRSSTDEVSFRVKNVDTLLTATGVTVSTAALTDTTPSVPAQHYVSLDGSLWEADLTIPAIPPLGVSQRLYLRRVTPSNAVMVPPRWALYLRAVPTSWS